MSVSQIHVGARQMVEFLYRTGGLSPVSFQGLSGAAGTRTHQAFYQRVQNDYRDYEARTEVAMKRLHPSDDFDLEISGRCDLLLVYKPQVSSEVGLEPRTLPEEDIIVEVKTVGASLDAIRYEGEPVHWAQSLMYAALYHTIEEDAHDPETSVDYGLAYVSQDTLETRLMVRRITRRELRLWFNESCERYIHWAQMIQHYKIARNESIQALRFPYAMLRDGQRELMETVLQAIRQTTPLLAEAPTGIGKTMATLYPALKSLPVTNYERIFYLTAKASTREVAEHALHDLAEQGLNARTLTMTPKEQLCLAPEFYCDTRLCPYAIHYYENLPEAMRALLPHLTLERTLIQDVARLHQVCPFELQLDLSLYCDVVIGDYNHAFDPRVRLDRFFGDQAMDRQILLIDEAHNLVDRAREMFSVTLEEDAYAQLRKALYDQLKDRHTLMGRSEQEPLRGPGTSLLDALDQLMHYFGQMNASIAKNLGGFDEREADLQLSSEQIAQTEGFRAIRSKAPELRRTLNRFLIQAGLQIDEIDDLSFKRKLIEGMASASFAVRIMDEFWDESYLIAYREFKGQGALRLICMDVAQRVVDAYQNRHAAIFFSATMTPMAYFQRNFCGSSQRERPLQLQLASPFPPEHLNVIIHTGIKTTYKDREATRIDLTKAIVTTAALRKGHQLCFFPSFAYMRQTMATIEPILTKYRIPYIMQSPQMTHDARQRFIERFRSHDGRPLIGFAVLGGIFGEGIDLVGSSLETVQIVSIGLPQLSPERELMKQYYDERMEPGFNYAYRFPGFTKILQAAGRLIRSENDQGTLVLYDARYLTPEYQSLLPEHWEPQYVQSLAELKSTLEDLPSPQGASDASSESNQSTNP